MSLNLNVSYFKKIVGVFVCVFLNVPISSQLVGQVFPVVRFYGRKERKNHTGQLGLILGVLYLAAVIASCIDQVTYKLHPLSQNDL